MGEKGASVTQRFSRESFAFGVLVLRCRHDGSGQSSLFLGIL